MFQLIANLGLIFFMFFLGLELDLDQIKKSWRVTLPVAAASSIIPGKVAIARCIGSVTVHGAMQSVLAVPFRYGSTR